MSDMVGVTHLQYDFDGGSCLRLLEREGLIQRHVFGQVAYEDVLTRSEARKLIFVDYSPVEPISDVPVEVYDHHSHHSSTSTERVGKKKETSFSILCRAINTSEYDPDKLKNWAQLVWMCDSQPDNDPMDVIGLLRNGVNRFMSSDEDSYEQWFTPLFDSFFANQPNLDRAIKIMREEILAFFQREPGTPIKRFAQKWIERARDKAKIENSSPRNFLRFLAYMDETQGREWFRMILEGYHLDQVEFRNSVDEFKRAKFDFFGDTLIISAVTERTKFVQAARATIFSDEDKPPIIDEKFVISRNAHGTIRDKNKSWVVIQVHPGTKNFQIFINGMSETIKPNLMELAKALRAFILIKRELSVPDELILACDGSLEGTEPLYYNRDVTYPQLLWGSIKHPKEPASPLIGRNATGIREQLMKITKLALDPREFAADCNPAACHDCPIYGWQLKKCQAKRNSVAPLG